MGDTLSGFLLVLAYALLPALGNLTGTALAENLRSPRWVIGAALHVPLLSAAGDFLKVDCEAPAAADVIVVLGGELNGERTRKGVELFKRADCKTSAPQSTGCQQTNSSV